MDRSVVDVWPESNPDADGGVYGGGSVAVDELILGGEEGSYWDGLRVGEGSVAVESTLKSGVYRVFEEAVGLQRSCVSKRNE